MNVFVVFIGVLHVTNGFVLTGGGLADQPLKLATFNIQVFGTTKYNHVNVKQRLLQIISRYDIVAIQEIRDATNTAFEHLRLDLNAYMKSHGQTDVYSKIVSGRLGRTSSKEQYGFLYRTNRVTPSGTYQYPDTHDVFEREPFGVMFHSPTTAVTDFVLVSNHLQPDKAMEEMDNLTAVFDTFKSHFHTSNVILAGDFNADCRYLSSRDWQHVSLRQDTRFTWLVGDNTDTTVGDTTCSYDRFVVGSVPMLHAVVPGSVKVYRFDEIMGIPKTEGLAVSDHYPVELQIFGKAHVEAQDNVETDVSFTVRDRQAIDIGNIRAIYRNQSCAGTHFSIKVLKEDTHMDQVTATMTSLDANDILPAILAFRQNCTGTLSESLTTMIEAYIRSDFWSSVRPTVYGLITSPLKQVYTTEVTCSLVPPNVCKVTVSRPISSS